jgi:hypothetical protein
VAVAVLVEIEGPAEVRRHAREGLSKRRRRVPQEPLRCHRRRRRRCFRYRCFLFGFVLVSMKFFLVPFFFFFGGGCFESEGSAHDVLFAALRFHRNPLRRQRHVRQKRRG